MPADWPTYAWYSAAAVFGALGLFLLLKWLVGDRSKGRRRCPKCWYDMSATPALTCPECGETARTERATRRTRRSLRMLSAGTCLGVLAIGCAAVPLSTTTNWRTAVPTTVLMLIVQDPFALTPGTPPALPAGLSAALPPSMFPRDSLRNELLYRYQYVPMSDWQFRALALKEIQPLAKLAQLVKFRKRWLKDETVSFCEADDVNMPRTNYVHWSIRATRPNQPSPELRGLASLGPASTFVDDAVVELALTVFKHPTDKRIVLRKERATVPIELVTTVRQLFQPLPEPATTQALRNGAFGLTVHVIEHEREPYLWIGASFSMPNPTNARFDVRVDLVHHQTRVATGRLLLMREWGARLEWTQDTEERSTLLEQWKADQLGEEWRVVITGAPEAPPAICGDQDAWLGSIDWPLNKHIARPPVTP